MKTVNVVPCPDWCTRKNEPEAKSVAWVYCGERQYIEGVPFGSYINPGDHYVSTSPISAEDVRLDLAIGLLDEFDRYSVGVPFGYAGSSFEAKVLDLLRRLGLRPRT